MTQFIELVREHSEVAMVAGGLAALVMVYFGFKFMAWAAKLYVKFLIAKFAIKCAFYGAAAIALFAVFAYFAGPLLGLNLPGIN